MGCRQRQFSVPVILLAISSETLDMRPDLASDHANLENNCMKTNTGKDINEKALVRVHTPPSKFLKMPPFGKIFWGRVRTVAGNTFVKFEVRRFNHFGAVSI